MSDEKKFTKNVSIAGQNMTLVSAISLEHLQNVADIVDDKLKNILLNKKPSSNLIAGIMLGVELCDEYLILKNEKPIQVTNVQNVDEIKKLKDAHKKQIEKLNEEYKKEIIKIRDDVNNKTNESLKFYEEELSNLNDLSDIVRKEEIEKLITTQKEELEDYKAVFEEEIKELEEQLKNVEEQKNTEIDDLKKINTKREHDVVKVLEENTKISEENEFLRKRIEELLKTYEINGTKDFLLDEEMLIEIDEIEIAELDNASNNVSISQKSIDISKSDKRKKIRRKGKVKK